MGPYSWLAVSITSELVATSSLRWVDGFKRPLPLLITVVCYLFSFYGLSLTLKIFPIGIVYAVWSGVGIAMISLIGWVFFRQVLDVWACFGITLILAGVLTIYLMSKSVYH
jgi:small multidrug resistance pump